MDFEKILCSPELIGAVENAWTWILGVTVPFLMIALRMFLSFVNRQSWVTKRLIMWGISYALPFLGNLIGQPDLGLGDLMMESGMQAVFIGTISELGWNKGLKPALKKAGRYNAVRLSDGTDRLTLGKEQSQ